MLRFSPHKIHGRFLLDLLEKLFFILRYFTPYNATVLTGITKMGVKVRYIIVCFMEKLVDPSQDLVFICYHIFVFCYWRGQLVWLSGHVMVG